LGSSKTTKQGGNRMKTLPVLICCICCMLAWQTYDSVRNKTLIHELRQETAELKQQTEEIKSDYATKFDMNRRLKFELANQLIDYLKRVITPKIIIPVITEIEVNPEDRDKITDFQIQQLKRMFDAQATAAGFKVVTRRADYKLILTLPRLETRVKLDLRDNTVATNFVDFHACASLTVGYRCEYRFSISLINRHNVTLIKRTLLYMPNTHYARLSKLSYIIFNKLEIVRKHFLSRL